MSNDSRPGDSLETGEAQPAKKTAPTLVEKTKAESDYLRGRIVEELAGPEDHFKDATAILLKHHGIYQQDDRDHRRMLGDVRPKRQMTYEFMVRTGVPSGRITSQQFLAQLDLADRYGNGSLRLSSRQDIQMHGVAKQNLRTVLRRIHEIGLTTLASGGDVHRNVVCCPAPYRGDPVHGQIQWLASQLSSEFAPKTSAYRQIWLDDVPATHRANAAQEVAPEVEPLYGKSYLPRKFKVAIGLPGDNCADVYSQDVGLLAICRDYNVAGYNVLVGGGMGMSPSMRSTYPVLAQRMAFAEADQALDVVRAILRVFRDFGDRSDRKHSRLKYLIAHWGLDRFKSQVEQILGYVLAPPRPDEVWDIDDHVGWREQGDGRWFYGLHVPGGRIQDTAEMPLKSTLREICEGHKPTVCLTPNQGLLLCDVYWEDRLHLEDHLRRRGIKLEHDISNVRRWSGACVSLPTCPLALTESERVMPAILDHLEVELARMGLERDLFALRMTGCANGCARPYNADIGIVGRAAGRYAIYLGGRRIGDRLGNIYRDGVPLEEIVAVLLPVFAYFKQMRSEGETLGDFCYRIGCDALVAVLPE